LLFIFHQPIDIKNSISKLGTSNQSFQTLLTDEKESLNRTVTFYVKDVIIKTLADVGDSDIKAKLEELKKTYP
jgi:hypothetical protein